MTPVPPPLDGIRVVDLTSYIAGSYAAMMLADLGAAVVKVESLEGDSFRELPGFFGWNRGKRSIALNLKTPEGREIVERLAREGDVLMENWRPGVADRLGVGPRAPAGAQSAADLLLGHRLRLHRSLRRSPGLRSRSCRPWAG